MSEAATGIVRAPIAPTVEAPTPGPLARDKQSVVSAPKEGDRPQLFTGYEEDAGHSFVAKHYGIENIYREAGNGVEADVRMLNEHIKNRIKTGDVEDSLDAVRKYLSHLEEVVGIQEHERTTMKLPQLVAYVRYMANKSLIKARHDG